MAPSGRTRKTTRRRRRRSNLKKKHESTSYLISSKDSDSEVVNSSSSVCSTPKGDKFRIPEISTCPPPPKKPRILTTNSSLRKSLSFFEPPQDLDDVFFCLALSTDLSFPFVC
ncbi:hypothetical protein AAHE18_07G011500 [Arachis hypogaea]|uniref:Uncharacterized protein n=1 Tax=Arachis hypogaea TaxID=3818 RepID=A0A445C2U9_ARAHY|nr:cyclin-dependent protein kinase inhibitor SMR9 [Arachis hypogaea]RYR45247.1 hypothetical protein Ahy_A07g031094 [Arachis hypogaea]